MQFVVFRLTRPRPERNRVRALADNVRRLTKFWDWPVKLGI